MTHLSATAPGWYHGVGDPPDTQRWWDGSRWITSPCRFDDAGRCLTSRPPRRLRDRLQESLDFNGRSTRREYWGFVAPLMLTVVGLYYAGALLADFGSGDQVRTGYALMIASAIVAALGLIPGTAAGVRRLHDTNRSGWWLVLASIPGIQLIGLPALLFFLTRPSRSDGLRTAERHSHGLSWT